MSALLFAALPRCATICNQLFANVAQTEAVPQSGTNCLQNVAQAFSLWKLLIHLQHDEGEVVILGGVLNPVLQGLVKTRRDLLSRKMS